MYHPHFRKNKNDIPILSKKKISDIAEGYIMDFCPDAISTPQPINIDFFLEGYLGLVLDYQYLSNSGVYLGMTVFNDTTKIPIFLPSENIADYYSASAGTVIIDTSLTAKKQINRYRFTAGHESGHWVFHRAYFHYDPYQLSLFEFDSPYIQCRESSLNSFSKGTRGWDDQKWMEWQADKFSSCLLMPQTAVRQLITSNPLINNTSELIAITADTFQVSQEAARYRLQDLGYIKVQVNDGQLSLF